MFSSPAYAQAAAPGGGDFLVSLLPLVLIFAVFYFLLIRPQQRRMKDHRTMISNLKRGDQVMTAGGIIGKIIRVEDDRLTVEIAKETNVQVARNTISELLSKPTPATGGDAAKKPQPAAKQAGGGMFGGLFGRK